MLRKTVFTIGEYPEAYIGYTTGRLWNGWATPHFELDEAMRVMQGFNETAEYPMQYDEVYDQFYILDTETTELEAWKGENCQTTEGMKHLYGIGAACWIWDEEETEPVAKAIDELFSDYDVAADYDEIAEALQNAESLQKALKILRSDDTAELQIKRLWRVLQW